MNILTLNSGSNSLKFEIVAVPERPGAAGAFGTSVLAGAFDDLGKHAKLTLIEDQREQDQGAIAVRDAGEATSWLLDWLEQGNAAKYGIKDLSAIDKIGHRVVHGADELTSPAPITAAIISRIEKLGELAPLHTASVLKVIRAAQQSTQARMPMIAVFDTAFHRTIPDEAALYALPLDIARRHRIRRYGFHGISHRYLMLRYAEIAQRPATEVNLVTLHLEGGCSATAIQRGRSIDNSMGLTPLEGLMMGTRSGDLDPGAAIHLLRKEGFSADELEQFLNKRCGLFGVSGVSADTRELVEQRSDPNVELALDMFCYRARKYVGAYLAALGGADALIFGGGIGENTPLIRERICRNLAWCGAEIDPHRNREVTAGEGRISTAASALGIWVIPTEEGLMMAKHVAELA